MSNQNNSVEVVEATERPWEVRERHGAPYVAAGPLIIADGIYASRESSDRGLTERRANAELIVRAVNAHDALVAALEPFANFQHENFPKYTHDGDGRPQVHVSVPIEELEAARAALSLAKGSK